MSQPSSILSAHPDPAGPVLPVVVVTGMSGAGLSTALKALEDEGYEAVDNLRLSLLAALVSQGNDRPLAVGIDSRTRGFTATALLAELAVLRARPGLDIALVFMDADDEVLLRRYTETRRPHPLAMDRTVMDGITLERGLMQPLRQEADMVVDSSHLSIHDARRLLAGNFRLRQGPALQVFVTSFAFRHGIPREADLVFDMRFLSNPHWTPALRPLTGLDRGVQDFLSADPGFDPFFSGLTGLLGPLLPRYRNEGKRYFTIALGCTGGKHRSVYAAHRLAAWLADQGHAVHESHRDLDQALKAKVTPPPPGPVADPRETP